MKPQTKIQHEVDALARKLKPITQKKINWAYSLFDKFYVFKAKNYATCFECAHTWEDKTPRNSLLSSIGEYTCPNCHKELQLMETRSWRRTDFNYVGFIIVVEKFQVIRTFHVERQLHKGYEARYWMREVYQHWLNEEGKEIIRAVGVNAFSNYSSHPAWNFKPMEIKREHHRYNQDTEYYPRKKVIPILKRNGFKNNLHNYYAPYLFKLLLTDKIFETLFKLKIEYFIDNYYNHVNRFNTYWSQVKICIRNNYRISHLDTWFDHLKLLHECGKDICSPRYICPVNLYEEHQKLITKRQKILDKRKLEEMREKIIEYDKIYVEEKKKFFGLRITNGEIDIIVLDSVLDFFKEGSELHHCVFVNSYYTRKDSLMLSARKGNERLETIEFDLKSFQVKQARGLQNKNSEYHNQILELLSDNVKVIKKIANARLPVDA